MENLTAATHTAQLAAAVMASGAVSILCQGRVWLYSTLKLRDGVQIFEEKDPGEE